MSLELPLLSCPKGKKKKNIWNYTIPCFVRGDLHSQLCSALEKSKWDSLLSSLTVHPQPSGSRCPSPLQPSPAGPRTQPPLQLSFTCQICFPHEILLALSFPSLTQFHFICALLALLSLSVRPAVLSKSNLSENQANKQMNKAPFCLHFSHRRPRFCREMAQLQENVDGITAVFYVCTRSNGTCSPLSREELRQLIKQEFVDVLEVRIRLCLLAQDQECGGAGKAMQSCVGHLGCFQMPSKPRICREGERLLILPAPAARRAWWGEQQEPQ